MSEGGIENHWRLGGGMDILASSFFFGGGLSSDTGYGPLLIKGFNKFICQRPLVVLVN